MTEPLTESDEGKRIVTADGEEVGTVEKVDTGVVHVAPATDLAESVKRRFDWGERGGEDYTLQETAVEKVTDEQLVLEREG